MQNENLKSDSNEAILMQKIIDSRINKKLYSSPSPFPIMWCGIVTAYDSLNKTATIYLSTDNNSITSDYPNLTNQSLSNNDIVYLMSVTGSLTNAFVAFKTLEQQI